MNYIFVKSKKEEIRHFFEGEKIVRVTILFKDENNDERIFELLKIAKEQLKKGKQGNA